MNILLPWNWERPKAAFCPYKPLIVQTLRHPQYLSNFQPPKFKFSSSGQWKVRLFGDMTKTSVLSEKNVPLSSDSKLKRHEVQTLIWPSPLVVKMLVMSGKKAAASTTPWCKMVAVCGLLIQFRFVHSKNSRCGLLVYIFTLLELQAIAMHYVPGGQTWAKKLPELLVWIFILS